MIDDFLPPHQTEVLRHMERLALNQCSSRRFVPDRVWAWAGEGEEGGNFERPFGDKIMLKTPLIIVLLLIVLVAVIPTIAEELPTINNPSAKQEAGKTTDSKQNTKTQNQNSTSPLTTINPTPSPPLQEIRENESPQYGKEQKSSWWDFSLTDVLLAIFTCGLVIVGWLQVRILKRNLRVTDGLLGVAQEQSKHMKTSIDVADKAAGAAQKSAEAAEKSVYAARETANVMRAQIGLIFL